MTSDGNIAISKPTVEFSEDMHFYRWDDLEIEATLERFSETRDGDYRCEISIVSTDPLHSDPLTLLTPTRLLLIGPNSRRDIARKLVDERAAPDVPWPALFSLVCAESLKRYRAGDPAVDLWGVSLDNGGRFTVRPIVTRGAVTIWYGDGDSAKSMLALAVGCSVAYGIPFAGQLPDEVGRVLYLDWEDDKETHAVRMRAILKGMGVNADDGKRRIIYKRMSASLWDSARELRRAVLADRVRLVVIDSVGMASGGDPSDADGVIKCLSAARMLGVSVIAIHHLPKAAEGKRDTTKPYGSIYAVNEARATWLVERQDDDPTGGQAVRLAMTNHKANRGRKQQRQALSMDFIEDNDENLVEVRITRLGFLAGASVGTGKGMRKWKILETLRTYGALTTQEIADHTDMTPQNVRATISDNPTMFVQVLNPNGRSQMWEAADTTANPEPDDDELAPVSVGARQGLLDPDTGMEIQEGVAGADDPL